MSEIKNPFLSNAEETENSAKQDSLGYSSVVNTAKKEPNQENELEGEIEIKDEGRLLRNIIIVLIVLLLLALLGLGLYLFLNKKNTLAPNSNIQNIESTNIPDFEMKGKEFKVNSIVIEK